MLAGALSLGVSIWAGGRIVAQIADLAAGLRAMGWMGVVAFAGIEFGVTLIGVVPGALLGIVAGAMFGPVVGFFASAAGILAGAMVAFGLSRSVLRPWIGRWIGRNRRLASLDDGLAKDGWRVVALLRVSPVMPFSITSYALGLSGIGLGDYWWGTLASMPPLLGYVIIGTLGGAGVGSHGGSEIHWALLGVGAAATLGLTVHLSRVLGRALRAV